MKQSNLVTIWILGIAMVVSTAVSKAQSLPYWDNDLSQQSQALSSLAYDWAMVGNGEYIYTATHGGVSVGVWRWSPCKGWESVLDEGMPEAQMRINAMVIWQHYLYVGGCVYDSTGQYPGFYRFVHKFDLNTGQLTALPIYDPAPPPGLPRFRSVQSLAVDSSGNVYIGCDSVYQAQLGGGVDSSMLLKWDGQTVSQVGGSAGLVSTDQADGTCGVTALAADGMTIYAGGGFTGYYNPGDPNFHPSHHVVGWDGANWIQMGGVYSFINWDTLDTTEDFFVRSIAVAPSAVGPKTIFVAGDFNAAGEILPTPPYPPDTASIDLGIGDQPGLARFLAEPFQGTQAGWPVTTGGLWWKDDTGSYENGGTAVVVKNGVVYVTGGSTGLNILYSFNMAGGVSANNIARLTDLRITKTLGTPLLLLGNLWTTLDSGLLGGSGVPQINGAFGWTMAANDTSVFVGSMLSINGPGFKYAGILESPNIARWVTARDPVPAPAGLVAWWKAEYTANDSQLANHGTLQGGADFASGKVSAAFSLDGDSGYVEVPSSPELKFTGPFSIEGWVNFDSINDSSDCIVAKGADDNGPVDWCLTISTDGHLRPHVNAGGNWFYRNCQTALQPGQWYHVAMVYDGSFLKGYVNGQPDGAWQLSGIVQTSDESLKIGVYGPNYDIAFFPGRIDELSLYSRALSSDEIHNIWLADVAGKCPPPCVAPLLPDLVSWWRAEDTPENSIGTGASATPMNGAGYAAGMVGRAFNLDGVNQYLDVPSGSGDNLKFTGPFTIEGWINYDHLTGTAGDAIVAKGRDAETSVDWALSVSSNHKLRPHVKAGGSWVWFDCSTTLTAGRWYHVAMVYDGSHLQGYVDGVFDGSNQASGPVQTSDYSLKIGAYAPVNGTASKAFFAGQIDELSLYKRALDTSEIQAICLAGRAGKCVP